MERRRRSFAPFPLNLMGGGRLGVGPGFICRKPGKDGKEGYLKVLHSVPGNAQNTRPHTVPVCFVKQFVRRNWLRWKMQFFTIEL